MRTINKNNKYFPTWSLVEMKLPEHHGFVPALYPFETLSHSPELGWHHPKSYFRYSVGDHSASPLPIWKALHNKGFITMIDC